jgi:4'-phosphopantetheinyl transferase
MHIVGSLSTNDIHVWQADLDDARWDIYSDVLSTDERERADRFYTFRLRQRYQRCRSVCRVLLGRYSSQSPASVIFRYGPFGKPEVADRQWHFNVSHSRNVALVAVAMHPVGIDVEFVDAEKINVGELINVICHPGEKGKLALLSGSERRLQLLQIWTQKESYLKALGLGLQHPLRSVRFDASIQRGRKVLNDNGSPVSFFVYEISAIEGYAASVCLACPDARLSFFSASSLLS